MNKENKEPYLSVSIYYNMAILLPGYLVSHAIIPGQGMTYDDKLKVSVEYVQLLFVTV